MVVPHKHVNANVLIMGILFILSVVFIRSAPYLNASEHLLAEKVLQVIQTKIILIKPFYNCRQEDIFNGLFTDNKDICYIF